MSTLSVLNLRSDLVRKDARATRKAAIKADLEAVGVAAIEADLKAVGVAAIKVDLEAVGIIGRKVETEVDLEVEGVAAGIAEGVVPEVLVYSPLLSKKSLYLFHLFPRLLNMSILKQCPLLSTPL